MTSAELVIFELGSARFSLPLSQVEEVVPAGAVTAIPNSPPFLLGLTAVRGKVLAVIDAAKRYRIGPSLSNHFLVCYVRGNLTAVAIDRPVVAGAVDVRPLDADEFSRLRDASGVHPKFLLGGFELLERLEKEVRPTGSYFLSVNPDLFVSAEMASKLGEA